MLQIDIKRTSRGYYTLYLDGKFVANCDTPEEAAREAEEVINKE